MADKSDLIDNARQMYLVELGKRLRELRKKAGLSQRRLAQAAGLTPSYMYLLEAGGPQVGVLTLRDLAIALGVSISAFFEEEDAAQKLDPRLSQISSQLFCLIQELKGRTDEGALIYQQIEQFIEEQKIPPSAAALIESKPSASPVSAQNQKDLGQKSVRKKSAISKH